MTELSKAIAPSNNRIMPANKTVINKFPKGGIGPQFVNRYIHKFEEYWHANKEYPNDTWIISEFGFTKDQCMFLNNSKFWLQSLDRRGIRRPETPVASLSPEQVAAIALITNYSDRRPVTARLEAMGVTQEMLHGWQSDPAFKRELEARARDTFQNIAPVAEIRLAQAIDKGNLNAIKFYFEVTGKAETPESINLKKAMTTMVEAIQKHCTPEQQQAIQHEINTMLGMKGVA